MVGVSELQRLNPVAWTSLLAREIKQESIVVTAVEQKVHEYDSNIIHYILRLDGYSESIGFLGKDTNSAEAKFYRHIAPDLPNLAPNCLLSHSEQDRSWIVFEEPLDRIPLSMWTAGDIEQSIAQMIRLHSHSWRQPERLKRIGFGSFMGHIGSLSSKHGVDSHPSSLFAGQVQRRGMENRIEDVRWDNNIFLSEHAVSSAGNLYPALNLASDALSLLIGLGVWPGVFESRHWKAVADLLDDPVPLLHPLRQMPKTLIHGDLSPKSWHLDILGGCYIVNWTNSKVGPSVYDLVSFVDDLEWEFQVTRSAGTLKPRPISEETAVDSYILGMGRALGRRFSPASTRAALPAARCLRFITHWLPQLADTMKSVKRYNVGTDPADTTADSNFENLWSNENQSLWAHRSQRFLEAYYLL